MDYERGGRGNKAPYETTHIRIPVPIKGLVQEAAKCYRESLSVPTINMEPALAEWIKVSREGDAGSNLALREKVQSQSEMIRAHLSEINYLKQKLHQAEDAISLADAITLAKSALLRKQSARATLIQFLSWIYKLDLPGDYLK